MASELIFEKYRLRKLAGTGAFSKVYEEDTLTGDLVAIKFEDLNKRNTAKREAQLLRSKFHHKSIPKVLQFARDHTRFIVVMQLLGESLYHLTKERHRHLSGDVLFRVMYQMLRVLKYLHGKGYVHMDIKPDNILIGKGSDAHRVFLIDFSETRKYPSDNSCSRQFVGNPYFASTAALTSERYGPKDDLESLGYVLGYLHTGSLPWIDVYDIDPSVCIRRVLDFRRGMDLRRVWTDIPTLVLDLVGYAQSLGSEEMPDYHNLLERLKGEAKTLSYDFRAQTPIWECRSEKPILPDIVRSRTVEIKFGQHLLANSEILLKIRNRSPSPFPNHSTSTAQTDDTCPEPDPTMATIVTDKLPVATDNIRNRDL